MLIIIKYTARVIIFKIMQFESFLKPNYVGIIYTLNINQKILKKIDEKHKIEQIN